MIYLTAIGLTPGGSSTVHIYTQIIYRTTQFTNMEECGLCPISARYTLAFALEWKKKHGKPSVTAVTVTNFECCYYCSYSRWWRSYLIIAMASQ
jgi:hypothetical protein